MKTEELREILRGERHADLLQVVRDWLNEREAGEKPIRESLIGRKVIVLDSGLEGVIMDPSETAFGASKDDPDTDRDGDYWVSYSRDPCDKECIGKRDSFDLID